MSYSQKIYRRYLNTEAWKLKSDKARAAADFRCQAVWNGEKCLNHATQTHHINYLNVFDEQPEDLMAICRSCHQRKHHIMQQVANDNQMLLPLLVEKKK